MTDQTLMPGDQARTVQQSVALGKELHQQGDLEAAERVYREILESSPEQPTALQYLGVIAYQRGRLDDAEDLIGRAVALDPDNAKAHNNLALVFKEQGRVDEAVASLRRAVAAVPDDLTSNANLGKLLTDRERWLDAEPYLRKAIALDPALVEAQFNLGRVLRALKKPGQALACYEKALALDPDFAEAHVNSAIILKQRALWDEAMVHLRRAITLRPDWSAARRMLLFLMNYSSEVSQAEIEAESVAWSGITPAVPADPRFDIDRSEDRRLRVGYVSPDFREHSVSYFFEPLLCAHDPATVETFCYNSIEEIPDEVTGRLKRASDHWREVTDLGVEDLAAMIRNDRIDILVDLAGHTGGSRLPVLARRPAPVQVHWLGYPNTTGLAAVDYRFVDKVTDPVDSGVERLLRLPNGFLCYKPSAAAPEPAPVRADGPVAFGSFNNTTKLSRACVELWSRLLHEAADATLLLKSWTLEDPVACDILHERFAAHGIGRERLRLLPRTLRVADHLDLYRQVDVCLDPFPYNGTTTTCEALWMGKPVVTLLGEHHRGRVGASILTRVGLDDLIAADADAYIALAAGLAGDVTRREALRETLRDRMAPMCDADAFARDVEAAYRTIWRRWCASAA